MSNPEDISLLKRYADGDESAFTLLVERYIHLVYSAALRQVGNPSHAEEISQAVFIILTRKAKSISPGTILSGWLYQTARLTAANYLRSENSRRQREQEVYMQSALTRPDAGSWKEIAPLLEEAMGWLGQADRDAIVLRFFENKTPQELATMLGLNEVTARKRVSRALERLRHYFSKRGVDSTTSAIAGTISSHAVQFAPAGRTKSVTAVALAKGTAAAASTLTLVDGALKVMTWTKMKTAMGVGAGVLVVATATMAWDVWPKDFAEYDATLKNAPPQVQILPTQFPNHGSDNGGVGGKLMGFDVSIAEMARVACASPSEYNWDPARTIVSADVPQGHYDYIANLPDGSWLALQKEMKRRFGVIGRREMRDENVLLLTVKNRKAPGLKPGRPNGNRNSETLPDGEESFVNYRMSDLAVHLERTLNIPVVDGTGLAGNFDFAMKRVPDDSTALKQTLLDQLGLELIPTNMPVEMLVVEIAK